MNQLLNSDMLDHQGHNTSYNSAFDRTVIHLLEDLSMYQLKSHSVVNSWQIFYIGGNLLSRRLSH